jgi:hypothetical protein
MITAKEASALVANYEEKAAALFLEQNLDTIYENIKDAALGGKREIYIKADVSMKKHSAAVIAQLSRLGFYAKLDIGLDSVDYLYVAWEK